MGEFVDAGVDGAQAAVADDSITATTVKHLVNHGLDTQPEPMGLSLQPNNRSRLHLCSTATKLRPRGLALLGLSLQKRRLTPTHGVPSLLPLGLLFLWFLMRDS